MRVSDLELLYEYGQWANTKLLGALRQLSPEQFTKNVGGSYGSIRNTLVHTVSAEWGWLSRCGGRERGPKLKADDYPTVESVASTWTSVNGYVREFLATLVDEDLDREIKYSIHGPEKHSMPLGELLHHAAIHGVHHRGQVALLMRMLGHAPGDFDILFFYGERRGASVT